MAETETQNDADKLDQKRQPEAPIDGVSIKSNAWSGYHVSLQTTRWFNSGRSLANSSLEQSVHP